MCDPVSHDDFKRIGKMITRKYASEIYTNITDVSHEFILLTSTPDRSTRIPLTRPNTITLNMISRRTMGPYDPLHQG